MAKWQPRVGVDVETELQSLGPYQLTHGGHLLWDPVPGFAWPWGRANLDFGLHRRNATDADYRRLLDAWRQVCARQTDVLDIVRDAVLDSWKWWDRPWWSRLVCGSTRRTSVCAGSRRSFCALDEWHPSSNDCPRRRRMGRGALYPRCRVPGSLRALLASPAPPARMSPRCRNSSSAAAMLIMANAVLCLRACFCSR